MVVYGDPQYLVSSQVFLQHLKNRLGKLDSGDLDQLRALLIQAGQFEQGLHDLSDSGTPQRAEDLAESRRFTDSAAEAFYSNWSGCGATEDISEHVGKLQRLEELTIPLKIPEGYEFYTLYPEQFCATARAWVQENRSIRRVL